MKITLNNSYKNDLVNLIGDKELFILENELINYILLEIKEDIKELLSFSIINNFYINYKVVNNNNSLIIDIKDIENENLNYNVLVF